MSVKRHPIVATLSISVLLGGLIFGTIILRVNGVMSSSEMIKHEGLMGGSIKFEVTAPNEAYPNEASYVRIKVFQLVADPVYIEFIKATVRYSWTLEETLVEGENLTGDEGLNVDKTFHLSDLHVPKPTWIGNHIFCDLDFLLHFPSSNHTARNLLFFSLGLVTEKTGGASESYPLNTKILIYALASTTVLFVATTIYFVTRKTKMKNHLGINV